MTIDIKYHLIFRIPARLFKRTLEIFNHLHTDEMILKHARGGMGKHSDWPASKRPRVKEHKWYSWVDNPSRPFANLIEAFSCWRIVDSRATMRIDKETKELVIEGDYDSAWGQQDFLMKQLAPVLNDCCISISNEDEHQFCWSIRNHRFTDEGGADESFAKAGFVERNAEYLTKENFVIAGVEEDKQINLYEAPLDLTFVESTDYWPDRSEEFARIDDMLRDEAFSYYR